MKKTFLFVGLILASGLPRGVLRSQFLLDLETGRSYSGYNDVAVPGKIAILRQAAFPEEWIALDVHGTPGPN